MEHQLIISIGREFGSGGHEIAEKLASHYNIPLLDQNLLDEIAKILINFIDRCSKNLR